MHMQLQNYIKKTKRKTQQNKYAHIFSMGFDQFRRESTLGVVVQALTTIPDNQMASHHHG